MFIHFSKLEDDHIQYEDIESNSTSNEQKSDGIDENNQINEAYEECYQRENDANQSEKYHNEVDQKDYVEIKQSAAFFETIPLDWYGTDPAERLEANV